MSSGGEATETEAAPRSRIRPVQALLAVVLRAAPQLRPAVEKLIWRVVYEAASLGRGDRLSPMNYGYAPLTDGADAVTSVDGYAQQMYARVAGAIDLHGLDVLEVGCGRGGGTAYVFEHFGPRSMTGLDLVASAVRRAQERYGRPGLRYLAGNAEHLPFGDASFDAVLNLESSHCYPNPPRFLEEVHRVLRPGGHLLLADIRLTEPRRDADGALFAPKDVATLHREIDHTGFLTLEEEDITANVVHALHLDSPRRRAQIERTMPRFTRPHVLGLMAVEGTPMFDAFASHRISYLRFCLQKP